MWYKQLPSCSRGTPLTLVGFEYGSWTDSGSVIVRVWTSLKVGDPVPTAPPPEGGGLSPHRQPFTKQNNGMVFRAPGPAHITPYMRSTAGSKPIYRLQRHLAKQSQKRLLTPEGFDLRALPRASKLIQRRSDKTQSKQHNEN